MRRSFRRWSLGRSAGGGNDISSSRSSNDGGGMTLKEKFDGEKSASSSFTDPTEASLSSSMCLSENGQVVVVNRSHVRPIRSATTPTTTKHPTVVPRHDPSDNIPTTPVPASKPKSQRRRSMFGSATPVKNSEVESGPDSFDGLSSPSTGNKPRSGRRRGSLFGLSTPFSSSDDHDHQHQHQHHQPFSCNVPTSPTATQPRSSRRRHSLLGNASDAGGKDGGSSNNIVHRHSNDMVPPESPVTSKPRSGRRRHSLYGGSTSSSTSQSKGPNANSTEHGDVKDTSKTTSTTINNPFDLINQERMKHNKRLRPLARNPVLCTLARDVSRTLACSNGASCDSTDYYGNVGKGTSIRAIHAQMMTNNGTERAMILSSKFTEVGIGLTRNAKDGQLYMCQLFK